MHPLLALLLACTSAERPQRGDHRPEPELHAHLMPSPGPSQEALPGSTSSGEATQVGDEGIPPSEPTGPGVDWDERCPAVWLGPDVVDASRPPVSPTDTWNLSMAKAAGTLHVAAGDEPEHLQLVDGQWHATPSFHSALEFVPAGRGLLGLARGPGLISFELHRWAPDTGWELLYPLDDLWAYGVAGTGDQLLTSMKRVGGDYELARFDYDGVQTRAPIDGGFLAGADKDGLGLVTWASSGQVWVQRDDGASISMPAGEDPEQMQVASSGANLYALSADDDGSLWLSGHDGTEGSARMLFEGFGYELIGAPPSGSSHYEGGDVAYHPLAVTADERGAWLVYSRLTRAEGAFGAIPGPTGWMWDSPGLHSEVVVAHWSADGGLGHETQIVTGTTSWAGRLVLDEDIAHLLLTEGQNCEEPWVWAPHYLALDRSLFKHAL